MRNKKEKIDWLTLIKRAILASILIGLGDYVLLKIGAPLGAFIFAFGLYGVCMLGANLFTGKCGFILKDKKWLELGIILVVNLAFGWLIGTMFRAADPTLADAASAKISGWEFSWPFFIRSALCGALMYIAVKCYCLGSVWGSFFGVADTKIIENSEIIANVITAGVGLYFDWTILLCAAGNFVGSVTVAWLADEIEVATKKKPRTKKTRKA